MMMMLLLLVVVAVVVSNMFHGNWMFKEALKCGVFKEALFKG